MNEPNVDSGKWPVLAVNHWGTKNAVLDKSCVDEVNVKAAIRFPFVAAIATWIQSD